MTLELSNQPPEKMPQARKGMSMRARITLVIILVAILTTIAIGYFSFARAWQTRDFLGGQFEEAVKGQAESQITGRLEREIQSIDLFFIDIENSVTTAASYAAGLIDNESTFMTGTYWDAAQELSVLPSGALDNGDNDPGAVFVPSFVLLNEQLVNELNSAIYLDMLVPRMLTSNPDITAIYFISARDLVIYYPNNNLASLVPPNFRVTEQLFFTVANPENDPDHNGAWTPPYQDPALTGLIVTQSSPVYDQQGQFRGVIGADVQLAAITERILQVQIGQTGYAFMIDPAGRIIALPDAGYADFALTPEEVPVNAIPQQTVLQVQNQDLQTTFTRMINGNSGFTSLVVNNTERYLAYAPIASTGYSVGLMVPTNEMNSAYLAAQEQVALETRKSIQYGGILFLFVMSGAILISFIASQYLTRPLHTLISTAQSIAGGDLTVAAPVRTSDEIGQLAQTFNRMTAELRGTLANMEQRVSERTADLASANESNQRRATQFAAVAQIGNAITSIENLETLLSRVTVLISEQLYFYHVGIFLNDEENRFTVLKATNSDGGHRMMERGHRLEIGIVGIVGNVADTGNPRIALDTGAEAIFFDNPDLSKTRSEIALPLKIGDRIIGVLDVQSTEQNAFHQEDVEILTVLADQISIAIENTRLLQETRRAFAEVQNTYRQYIRQEWQATTTERQNIGYKYAAGGIIPLEQPHNVPEVIDSMITGQPKTDFDASGLAKMAIPIKLRGETIGTVNVRSSLMRPWEQDEVDIAQAAAERVALTLENARLLSTAQRRAAKERTIGEISARIGSLVDIDNILQTAAREMSQMLPGSEVVIQFQKKEQGGGA